ncbi:MAG: hypothetical protein IT200_11375 [Thermoleophilia bacterium]|nr:hypothetical protein [Thermoleophilia bacterium]
MSGSRPPVPTTRAVRARRGGILLAAGVLALPGVAAADQAGSATRGLQAGALDAGWRHTCAVTDEGAAYCWGDDFYGQLGDGAPQTGAAAPSRVPLPDGREAVAVTAGDLHTCALLDDTSVWCWGHGISGQRGDGTTTSATPRPVRVLLPQGAGARSISAGGTHTCAVLADGGLWCWGDDLYGQLGDGPPSENRTTPVRVAFGAGRRTVAVSAGASHTCAILDDGSAWCWGLNTSGQLGDNDLPNAHAPVAVALPASTRVVAVAAGAAHTCATFATGASACWGDDSQGTVGDGPPFAATRVPVDIGLPAASVIAAAGHACLGAPYATLCWGDDFHGQLGNGPDTIADQSLPGAVLGIPSSRSVVALTAGGYGNGVTQGGHTCAAYDDGSVVCWGDDAVGQLGNGPGLTGSITRPDLSTAALPPGSLAGILADLSLDAEVPPALVTGRSAQAVLRVRNAGPDPADGVRVTLAPAALALGTPEQGTVTGGVWDAGTIPAGGEAVLRIPVTGNAPGAASLTAEITAVGAPAGSPAAATADPDSTPGNAAQDEDDRAVAAVTVTAPPAPGAPGAGTTRVRCATVIRGTARGERLTGTPRADRITGRGGADRILGRGGADCLSGGPGRDRLEGGAGDDTLGGDAGGDLLIGGTGRDLLAGGAGADVIRTRDGVRDVVRCGPGRDTAVVDRRDAVTGCEIVVRR